MAMNTTKACCIENVEQAKHLGIDKIPRRVEPTFALMCEPTFFTVLDVKNEFMQGNVGAVDLPKAIQQWNALKDAIGSCGFPVLTVPAVEGLEDMVFSANQVLPGMTPDGTPYVVSSTMAHESRRREVPHYLHWFAERGYTIMRLTGDPDGKGPIFEGQGDAIWHPGRQLLWAAYGIRTEERSCELLSKLLDVPVVKLKLVTTMFYHLDAALCAVNERTAIFYPGAFDQRSVELIRHYFPDAIEVSDKEARNFACNALALKEKIILQEGSVETCKMLRKAGLEPIELDTSEFLKSGGSVFCMKVLVY